MISGFVDIAGERGPSKLHFLWFVWWCVKAGVALDNEGEVKRVKQAIRLLLLDEDDINDGRTDAEVRHFELFFPTYNIVWRT